MTCQKNSSQRGSALLIIVGVLAVLTVAGLAYSARSISTVRQTAHSTQADQAYACAEAGAEEALGKLENGDDSGGSGRLEDQAGKLLCTFDYTVESDPAAGIGSYEFILEQDLTAQINLADFSSGSLNWYKEGQDTGNCPDRAALLAALVYYQGGYQMTKEIHDPCKAQRSPDNGFTQIDGGGVDGYVYGYPLSVPAHDSDRPVLLRLRALYTNTHGMIKVETGVLPEQGKKILSTGRAGEAAATEVSVRQVEVKRSNPALPTIFDYVLFSSSPSPLPQ